MLTSFDPEENVHQYRKLTSEIDLETKPKKKKKTKT